MHGKGPISLFCMLMFSGKLTNFLGNFLQGPLFFPLLNIQFILVKNRLSTEVSLFLCSQFYSILLFVYSYARTTNFDYLSFLMHFEIRKCESFSFVLFQRYYCYSGIPWKSMWILAFVHFCKKKKKGIGVLIGIASSIGNWR